MAEPFESLRVHSPRLAACAVIPADARIQKADWMPDQVRHDGEYPAVCAGVVHFSASICVNRRPTKDNKWKK
jgi:hypothetical protein